MVMPVKEELNTLFSTVLHRQNNLPVLTNTPTIGPVSGLEINCDKIDNVTHTVLSDFLRLLITKVLSTEVIDTATGIQVVFNTARAEWNFTKLINQLNEKITSQTSKALDFQTALIADPRNNAKPHFEFNREGHVIFGVTLSYAERASIPAAFEDGAKRFPKQIDIDGAKVTIKGSHALDACNKILAAERRPSLAAKTRSNSPSDDLSTFWATFASGKNSEKAGAGASV